MHLLDEGRGRHKGIEMLVLQSCEYSKVYLLRLFRTVLLQVKFNAYTTFVIRRVELLMAQEEKPH